MIEEEILSKYQKAPWLTQRHIKTRLTLCPFAKINEKLPEDGEFLDIGCGHGHLSWYLQLKNTKRKTFGCDIDSEKIKLAQQSCDNQNPCPNIQHGLSEELFDASVRFDAITIIDILYLIEEKIQLDILRWAVSHLNTGGRIVLKVLDTEAGWKTKKALFQEWIMVSLLKKTARSGNKFDTPSPQLYKEWLETLGCEAEIEILDTMNPSALIFGSKR